MELGAVHVGHDRGIELADIGLAAEIFRDGLSEFRHVDHDPALALGHFKKQAEPVAPLDVVDGLDVRPELLHAIQKERLGTQFIAQAQQA